MVMIKKRGLRKNLSHLRILETSWFFSTFECNFAVFANKGFTFSIPDNFSTAEACEGAWR